MGARIPAAVVLALSLATALAACGAATPAATKPAATKPATTTPSPTPSATTPHVPKGAMLVQGHEVVVISSNNDTEIQGVFPGVTGGTRVTVSSLAGKIIGSGVLRFNSSLSGRDGEKYNGDSENVSDFIAVYDFTVIFPAKRNSYGIAIGSGHGTVWFTAAKMRSGPVLTLGSLYYMLSGNSVHCPVEPDGRPVSKICTEHAGGARFVR
jgi:hypothetical protein